MNVSTVLKILSSVSWWWSELNWKQSTAARTDSLENFILKPYLCLNMYFVLKRTLYWYETSLYGNVISIPCSFRASKCKRRVSCVSHVSNPLPWFQRWPNAILNFWWLCWIGWLCSAECCGYNQTSRKYFESQSVYFFDKRKRKAHLIKTFCFRRTKFVQICVTQQVDVIRKFVLICQHSEVSGDSKKNMTGNTSSPANLYHPSVILN